MVAVPLPRSSESSESPSSQPFHSGVPAAGSASLPVPSNASAHSGKQDWTHLVGAGSVVAGGILMVTGHKRAGLTVAAVGTMVALLDEPQTLEGWWQNLPGYLKGAEELLNKVESYLDEASKQGRRLQSILHR